MSDVTLTITADEADRLDRTGVLNAPALPDDAPQWWDCVWCRRRLREDDGQCLYAPTHKMVPYGPFPITVELAIEQDREAGDALMPTCDYYRGVGSCSFGCTSEPSCMTDRPSAGWPGEVVATVTLLDGHPASECVHRIKGDRIALTTDLSTPLRRCDGDVASTGWHYRYEITKETP